MASDNLKRLRGDSDGAVLLEFTIFVGVFFTLLFGIIEFSLAFYQWNAATKAVQLGARLAAVSDPMASGLESLTGMEGGADPGDPMTDFSAVCQSDSPTGATGSCTCTGFSCSYDANSAAAMQTIVYGRGNSVCKGPKHPTYDRRNIGMCNMFSRVSPENVRVTYSYTGMGYAGRPGGPVPTIRVELVGIPFQFFFLNGLLGFGEIDIPGLASTMSGEDLSISGG